MPTADDLPKDLQALARRQAVELSESAWTLQITQLIDGLETRIARGSAGRSAEPRDPAVEPKHAAGRHAEPAAGTAPEPPAPPRTTLPPPPAPSTATSPRAGLTSESRAHARLGGSAALAKGPPRASALVGQARAAAARAGRRRAFVVAAAVAAALIILTTLTGHSPSGTDRSARESPTASSDPNGGTFDAGTITPGGPPVTVKINKPGTTARLRFRGREGQRFSVVAPKMAIGRDGAGSAWVSVFEPGASENLQPLRNEEFDANNDETDRSITVEQDGIYTIAVRPEGLATGSLSLRLRSG
jgi:hypothetical protein